MKQLLADIIMLAILCHSMSFAVVFVSFKINQDYIAKTRSINRNNPESNCYGCCQLKKELEEKQQSDNENPENEVKKIEIQYFPGSAEHLRLIPVRNLLQFQLNLVPDTYQIFKKIFHPPRFYFNYFNT